MKNILLEAFINDLVMLGEAGTKRVKKPAQQKDKKPPNAKYTTGGRWYTADPNAGGVYVGRYEGPKWVNATPEEKAKEKEKASVTKGYGKDFIGGQGRGITPPSTPAQPKIDTQQTIDDLEAKAKRADGEKRQVIEGLIQVMRSGDKAKIQKYITDNNIHVGKSYRLKAKNKKKESVGGRKGFIGEGGEELSLKVFMVLRKMGIMLTHEGGKEVDVDKFIAASSGGKKKNPFKPQNTFGEVEDVLDIKDITRDTEGNVTGCTVEGERLDKITPDEEKRIIEERVSQVRQRFGGELSQKELEEFEQNVEEYIKARNREHNANIDLLVEIQEKRGAKYLQFPREGETTEGATARMVTKLDALVDAHIKDPKKEVARTALKDMAEHATKMRTAKTREERREAVRAYNAALAAFQTAAEGSALGTSISDVGESLVALRSVALGKTVLIPDSQSFPLADVVTIGKNPVTGENSIELFVVHVDAQESISVADSVKAGAKGNAGVTYEKDAHSEFSPVSRADGSTIDGGEVKTDLVAMGGVDRKNAIFTTDGKLVPAEKERIVGELEKYGDEVRAYFGLPTDLYAEGYLNAEQLYDFLSYGKKIACVDGKPAPSSDGTRTADTDKATNPENYEQWQAWGVVGLMHEAVHNRTVRQQFYRTSQIKRNGLVIADGARTMAKAESQFSKGTTRPEGRSGKVPNSSMVAFSIPAEEKELRNGNPCTQ